MNEIDVQQFAKDVAEHLEGWTLRDRAADESKTWANLDGPNGASISFRDEGKGKVEVNPSYIRYKGSQYPSKWEVKPSESLPGSISVGAARGPNAVAKDIKRRLIDLYLPVYELGRKSLAEYKAYEAAKQAVVNEFAALVNDDEPNEDADSIGRYVYKPGHEGGKDHGEDVCHVEIRVNSPTSFNLEINSLDADTLKKILALFPKLPKGQRTLS